MKKTLMLFLTILLFITGCSKKEETIKPSEVVYWGINDDILYLSPTKQGYAINENTSLLNSVDWNDIPWYWDDNGVFDWYKDIDVNKIEILKDDFVNMVPKSTAYWFYGLNKCIEIIGLENIDTSYVTNMEGMFLGLNTIVNLNVSSLNTCNVVNMKDMFAGLNKIIKLDLSSFNTSNVINMSGMFDACFYLKDIDVSSFDTSNVTDMSSMFDNCGVEHIDVSNFNTSNVERFDRMFGNTKLNPEKIDVSNFDISKAVDVDDISDLFGFHM